jgi:hypothetical protein
MQDFPVTTPVYLRLVPDQSTALAMVLQEKARTRVSRKRHGAISGITTLPFGWETAFLLVRQKHSLVSEKCAWRDSNPQPFRP